MTRRKPLVAGNWKMNGMRSALGELDALADGLEALKPSPPCEVMICPPATLLMAMRETARAGILVGAQDCHSEPAGAHTGDISAEMLADAGAVAVIVGHSERRQDHGESDETVRAKAMAAHRAGLTAIVCIGETQTQRAAGETLDLLTRQLTSSLPDAARGDDTVVAYEPVWAIGSGVTPTPADIAEAHAHIRAVLARTLGDDDANGIRILYGGSVTPDNARELMAVDGVDGALVGGASLKARDFLGIIKVYQA